MYVPHVRGTPLQQLLRGHLHKVAHNQRQRHANEDRVVADQPQRQKKNRKGPKENESRQKPPCVFDAWDGEFLRSPVRLVAGLAQRPVPLPCRVHLLSRNSGRLPVVVLRKPICTVLQQLLYASLTALDQRPVQGRKALVVGSIHVCAPAQEQVHTRGIALVRSPHERSVGLRVGDVDGNILVQEEHELVDVAVEGGRVEEVEALVVGEEGVGAVLEQQVHDVVVAAFGGPEDGRSDGIAAFGVERRAGLDEEVAERIVVVDGGPLFTSQL